MQQRYGTGVGYSGPAGCVGWHRADALWEGAELACAAFWNGQMGTGGVLLEPRVSPQWDGNCDRRVWYLGRRQEDAASWTVPAGAC